MNELHFHNPRFEAAVRNVLQIYDRPLSIADAEAVVSLDLSEFRLETEDFETLSLFHCLKELCLETYDSSVLPVVNRLTQLEILDLVLGDSSADLRQIAGLNNLKDLTISGGDWSSMDILHLEALADMKRLESLMLHEFGSVDLKPLERMSQLTSFFCGYADRVDHLSSIAKLIHLSHLYLIAVEADSLAFLSELPDSVSLDLCGTTVLQNTDLNQFRRFAAYDLTGVTIAGQRIFPDDLLRDKDLYQACCELPCDFAKVRHLLETKHYSPTELMHTAVAFANRACWAEEDDFAAEYGREPQQGELHVHSLYDLLKLFLAFGLNPNEITNDENIMSSLCRIFGPDAPNCMRLLLEHGGDPNLVVDGSSIFGRMRFQVDFDIGEYCAEGQISLDDMIHTWFVMLGYGGRSTDDEEGVEMKSGHAVEELRMHEQFTYTIETSPEENVQWIMHIIHKETGEEVAVF